MTTLDTHAHVEPDIAAPELEMLGAHIVAMTRTLDEYETVQHRRDKTTTWGLGCHPGLARHSKTFDPERFRELMATAAVIGEVGLDGSSRVPLDLQVENLASILRMLADTPLVTSLHSAGATSRLIGLLEKHPLPGLVLHWWRGTSAETTRVVDLGCYFSVNSRDLKAPAVVGIVPRERVLTETDHPFGDRSEPSPRRPGHMPRIVSALADAWGATPAEVIQQTWRNWRDLSLATQTADRLPPSFQRELLGA